MRVSRSVASREIALLIVLIAASTLGFFLTRSVAADSRQTRLHDAAVWAAAGAAELTDGRLSDAIDALRHATALDRANGTYGLTLARALSDDRQYAAAQQVLLGIRNRAPEDPSVNLQLARLAASTDDLSGAVRYYQNALYGYWSENEEARRREIRVELVKLLLAHHEDSRALSELLVLSANLPAEAGPQVEVGQLFLDAGDAGRAFDRFTRALQVKPDDGDALAGAGEAAFALGEYPRAREYLRRAPDTDDHVRELRTIADLVISSDPLAPRLASSERQRRAGAAFAQAFDRLNACLERPTPDPPALTALKDESDRYRAAIDDHTLRQLPDAVDTGFELAFRIEQASQNGCGPADPLDRAILLVGRRHGLENS
jgi:tetratricopeptide (TPR) repeat protein